ncbi:MAG: recombinase family protein [Lachnospiraceae bacterium]|nr:recombinase family protein [Lachnospiraceae bacterium]
MAMAKRFVQNNNRNAICYYRYSSDAQREASIEEQRDEAHRYAKAHGMNIIKEYSDKAMSGTREDRPQFQLMLYEVKKLRPAYLILWKTDRLSRDKIDSVIAKKHLREAGCEIVYVAESMPEDEADRVLLESLYEGLAQHYVIQHKRNVTRGMKYNAENCLYNGHVTLGYKGKPEQRYEIDEQTAPVVKMIYRKYADGVPMKQIVDDLNKAGIKSVKGNDFTINSLRHILSNKAYIGEYHWGEYVIQDGMPRIIEDELFDAVQEKMALNKHGGNRKVKEKHPEELKKQPEEYWLTDYITCGHCGERMHGLSGTSKQGRLHYYYACGNHRKHKCEMKNINKAKLENVVLYMLSELIQDGALRILIAERCYKYYIEQNSDGGAYLESIIVRIADVDKKLNNIMKAIEAGIFNDTTAQRMKELELEKQLLVDEKNAEECRQKYEIKLEDIVKYLDSLIDNMDETITKHKLLEILVNKIYIYKDKVVVSFNYSEDNRIISFDEFGVFISNREKIETMMDEHELKMDSAKAKMLASLIDDDGEGFDFFV